MEIVLAMYLDIEMVAFPGEHLRILVVASNVHTIASAAPCERMAAFRIVSRSRSGSLLSCDIDRSKMDRS
jgi:hypothetical protein